LRQFIFSFFAFIAAPVGLSAAPEIPAPPTDLVDYVTKTDDSFSWKLADTKESDTGTVYTIDLISQTWHEIKWDHKLQVFVPKGVKPQATMVLWNQGGEPNPTSSVFGMKLAEKAKAPVAFLFGVPKQPLFEGMKEDALIAETFVKYLESKDGSWPLLFPMVKSVVSAMDALQAFAKDEWKFEVHSFIITGASKRGWTTWLTAATGDKRVKAIAPFVIDTLNMPEQAKNQVKAFGKPSEMIKDYTERKLVPIPDTPEAKKLWTMIDPWVYREKLTVPKLLVNGTNDPYWPLDALNSYWNDLRGDKWILYVPNAGHDLREADKDGKRESLPARAVNTLGAFCYCHIYDKPMPRLTWEYIDAPQNPIMTVTYTDGLKGAYRWRSAADTRDFRKSHWTRGENVAPTAAGATRLYSFAAPEHGFAAEFAEFDCEVDGLKFTLSTPLRILEAKK